MRIDAMPLGQEGQFQPWPVLWKSNRTCGDPDYQSRYVPAIPRRVGSPGEQALTFIFGDPEIVRGIVRYTLQEIQPDGSITYGIVGSGVPIPCVFLPSDQELWLLWLISEYVLATRDKAFSLSEDSDVSAP